MMAAVMVRMGTTYIENAAREPEIADLASMPQQDGRWDHGFGYVDDSHRRCR